MKQFIDFEKYNPFRRPDWRFERVLSIVDQSVRTSGTCGRLTRFDDQYTRELRKFLLKYRNKTGESRKLLGYAFPGLYWAYQAYEQRDAELSKLATMLEARLLSGQSNEEIAKLQFTLPDTAHWYELAFFNVRDRLEAHDWIIEHVLLPAYRRDMGAAQLADDDAHRPLVPNIVEPFFDSTLKFFAYYGGPYVLDIALTGFRRGTFARSPDEVFSWFDQQTRNVVRSKVTSAAAKLPVTRWNVMELLNVHTQIMAIEKSDSSRIKQDTTIQTIEAMLKEIPWAFGRKRLEAVKGTLLEPLERSAAEPRDAELQLLSAGIDPGNARELALLGLPAPQQQKNDQESSYADTQQSS